MPQGYKNNRPGMRRFCPKCRKTYPRDRRFFYYLKTSEGSKRFQSHCIKCQKRRSQLPHMKEAAKVRFALLAKKYSKETDNKRDWRLRMHYGISLDVYNTLFMRQGGKCKICNGVSPSGKRLCVDHHGATGIIRGLLCHSCNMAIGYLKDSPELLQKTLKYLSSHANIKPSKEAKI